MIVPGTEGATPRFDFDAAKRLYESTATESALTGEMITSPFDIFAVETLRDRHGLRVGDAVPTDVFVFGFGEPDDPRCTKIGGRPFWPKDRPWPTEDDGSPRTFLAQINVAGSADLIGTFPMPIFVLTSRDGTSADDVHCVPADAEPDLDLDVPTTVGEAGPFWGASYRTFDYPEAEELARETGLSQAYLLPILNGTKVGGRPHFIQGGIDLDARFLFQIGSVQAEPKVRYPWINRETPLTLDFDDRGIYGRKNEGVFADMGTFYFFLDGDRNLHQYFESY